jgi:hypothetical protein
MRTKIYLLFAVAVVLWVGSVTGTPKQLFSLSIAPPQGPKKAGAELPLLVTVTNTSHQVINFATSPGTVPDDSLLYSIDVRDEQGRPAPPSDYVRNRDPRVPINYGSTLARTLKPGESFVDQVMVTRFYDLSRPGKYMISVDREIPSA